MKASFILFLIGLALAGAGLYLDIHKAGDSGRKRAFYRTVSMGGAFIASAGLALMAWTL